MSRRISHIAAVNGLVDPAEAQKLALSDSLTDQCQSAMHRFYVVNVTSEKKQQLLTELSSKSCGS